MKSDTTQRYAQRRLRVELDGAEPIAECVLRRLGNPTDGKLIWQTALLVVRRLLRERWLHSAAEGARLCATRNPVGYYRRCLAETCAQHGGDLDVLLRIAHLPPDFDRRPAKHAEAAAVLERGLTTIGEVLLSMNRLAETR